LSLYQSPLIPSFHNEPEIREMLRSANACGAITTTKKGAIPLLFQHQIKSTNTNFYYFPLNRKGLHSDERI